MDIVTADAQRNHRWQPQPCGSQALDEVRHRLVDVFLWQLFPDSLQGIVQLNSHLKLRLEFIFLFQHGVPYVVRRVQDKPGEYQ